MSLYTPFCFQGQFDQYLELYCNTYRRGHSILYWSKASDPNNVFEIGISKPHIVISGIDSSDTYTFYTADALGNKSDEVSVYLNYIPAEELGEKIYSLLTSSDDSEYMTDLLNKLKEKLVTSVEELKEEMTDSVTVYDSEETYSYNIYFATKDIVLPIISYELSKIYMESESPVDDEISAYQLLSRAFIEYDNKRQSSLNKYNGEISMKCSPYPLLNVDLSVDKVDILTLDDDCLALQYTKEPIYKSTFTPPTLFGEVYIVNVYGDSDLLTTFRNYYMNEDIMKLSWDNDIAAIQDMDNALSTTETYDDNEVGFTSDEITYAIQEDNFDPVNWIVPRPTLTFINDSYAVIKVNWYDVLVGYEKDFYLAARETEVLLNSGYEYIQKIDDNFVKIVFNEARLGGDMLIYVVDKNHTQVSKSLRISTETSLEEYRERRREYEISAFKKKVITYFKKNLPTHKELIDRYFSSIEADDSDYIPEEYWSAFASEVIYNENPYVSPIYMLYTVYQIATDSLTMDVKMLNNIEYSREEDILTIPFQDSYDTVATIMEFNDVGIFTRKTYHLTNTSMPVSLQNYEYGIIYITDANSYIRSGFIAFERVHGSHKTLYYKATIRSLDGLSK